MPVSSYLIASKTISILDVSPVRVNPAPVHAGVQAEAGVEALLEGGARDPHPVSGAHRPVCVDLIVEEKLQAVLPV